MKTSSCLATMEPMLILLIEDDAAIAAVIKRGLEEARFSVSIARTGTTGLDMARHEAYDLIILDLMLPGRDGWSVCEALRSRRLTTPILMVTARDAVDDRVRGLEIGADDYLSKPFEFKELLARVRALLRRERVHKARMIRIADLEIDTGGSTVKRAGHEILLTRREYTLLEALAVNEGRILTRDAILERVWDDPDSYSNTVDVQVAALRRKVDAGHNV